MSERCALDLPLRAVQEWFVSVATHPESVHAGLDARARVVTPLDLERVVRPGPEETAQDRLEIYRHSYFSRLVECLADDYPALEHALGSEGFEQLCRAYIIAHPSREPNLNGFGRHLPGFAESRLPELGRFAGDLARLEWALVEVLHAPAPQAFSAAVLQSIPVDRLDAVRLVPSAALRVLSFEYPVNAFLQTFLDGQDPHVPSPKPASVAVVRKGYKIWRLELDPTAATLLRRLQSESLGRALDGIDASAERVQAWFHDWSLHGMFERVLLGDAEGPPR